MSTCTYVPKAYTRLRDVSLCCAAIAPPPAVALTRRRKISVRYLRCSFTTLQQPPTINKERSLLKYHMVLLYILSNNYIYIYIGMCIRLYHIYICGFEVTSTGQRAAERLFFYI